MEKLLAMYAAAQLTQAACGGGPNNLPVSQDLSDATVRAKNLQVWETFRVYYRGVVSALQDETSWPSPKISAGSLLPNLLQTVAPLLASGPFADIAKRLLAALPMPSIVPSTPIPDPGAAPHA